MEYTLLMLMAPGPVSGAQIEEAVRRRSAVPLFTRHVKSMCRDEAANVLERIDPVDLPGALRDLEDRGLVQRVPPTGGESVATYALTEEGRERVFGRSRALWRL